MAPYQPSSPNRSAIRNTGSSTSPTTEPNSNLSANLKTLWPSPHKSNLQVTTDGVSHNPIMYPGAKTVASTKVSNTSPTDQEKESSNNLFSLQFLALQKRMQQGNRFFNMLVNIIKAQHEAAKAMIDNLK